MYCIKKMTLLCAIVFCCNQISIAQIFAAEEIVIAPTISIEPEGRLSTVKEGERLTLKAKGGDDQSILQWQVSIDSKFWQDIPKANGNVLETMPLTHNSYFRIVSRPLDSSNAIKIETTSNIQIVTIDSNVASSKKK
jgi:hypothetical protein